MPDITQPYVTVKGTAKGDLHALFVLLQRTPLAAQGMIPKSIEAKGNTTVHLDLGVPLTASSKRAKRLSAALDLDGTSFRTNPRMPMIEDMHGRITFDATGLHAEAINATVYDHPIVISARSQRNRTVFTTIAKALPAATIARLAALPPPLFEGRTDWKVDVTLPLLMPDLPSVQPVTSTSPAAACAICATTPAHQNAHIIRP